ncbi:hypothetical protein TUM4438_02970 [Shewanella sairae]|uniref:OmpR/PhoB-type domain-containing protein n=1 Tax=Shewanella sairae TaxID=190310 RepID=A0ABQ4P044_9GAMM|nr:winged helix-turn-helix domain-containing protein [Shewanella sairae]MCL1131798.1 winged helix-turn-helix domain-containing protein [Shewanella sairae]GIU40828.1 hypothetical protein TUM4438_02970 [Shewanella sairae]
MSTVDAQIKINDIEVDFVSLRLRLAGQWRAVEARQMALLKLLVDNHGNAVSRQMIMNELWQDTVVSDNSISQAITQLRKALGDDQETPRFIRTVPRVGYQLIATPTPIIKNSPSDNTKPAHITWWRYGIAIALGALSLFALQQWSLPSIPDAGYQYESRLTSVPGPESFLRYSPNGRYLAFTQISDDRSQMDIVVYDAQTQGVHTIKNTGYSEEAPEWSPDGKWLLYYRHDPLSCDIRIMSVSQPVETWRLSPDMHISQCAPGYSRAKLHWLSSNVLYHQVWQDNRPTLVRSVLAITPEPKLVSQQTIADFSPLTIAIAPNEEQMLLTEQLAGSFVLKRIDLTDMSSQILQKSLQAFWGVTWHDNDSYWIGNNELRLVSLRGHEQVVHLPIGFIPDIDINPKTQQLAHAEGLVNVNLYALTREPHVNNGGQLSRRLSSSARTDILPSVSANGDQTAFISYQRRSMDGLRHAEVWLKHRHKKAASLLVNLPESLNPDYLLWSPNGENILVGDRQQLYLINTYSRHMVPIVSGYRQLDKIRWSTDGKQILFSADTEQGWQQWQYDLQLASVTSLTPLKANKTELAKLQSLTPAYLNYTSQVANYLSNNLTDELAYYDLQPSMALYQPAITHDGIYYVLRQGHKLKLYYFEFANKQNRLVTLIGHYEQEVHLKLTLSASMDGSYIVFAKVEPVETDILLQRKLPASD